MARSGCYCHIPEKVRVQKPAQVADMDAVYRNSLLTIITASRVHNDAGLPGIKKHTRYMHKEKYIIEGWQEYHTSSLLHPPRSSSHTHRNLCEVSLDKRLGFEHDTYEYHKMYDMVLKRDRQNSQRRLDAVGVDNVGLNS